MKIYLHSQRPKKLAITITLHNLGKKFGREWVFRNLSTEILAGQKLVILGGNGSGKSTLLQVISGFVTPNEGSMTYSQDQGKKIEPDQIHRYISFASPYIQLVEDFTLLEMVEHAGSFKPFMNHYTAQQVIALIQLEPAKHKPIKQFSSGMKQRLKLGLAILAETPVILLDEPVSNLDKNAIQWYKALIQTYGKEKTVIVCSNAIEEEYFFCERSLTISDYKMVK